MKQTQPERNRRAADVFVEQFKIEPPQPWLVRNGIPIAVCLVAAIAALLFQPFFIRSVFLLFWPAVVLSTWYGGLPRGLLATGFALLFINHFLDEPFYAFEFDANFAVRAIFFIITALLVGLLQRRQLRAEQRARAVQQEILDIVESISDPFYGLDEQWRFIYVNPAAAAMWKMPREQLLGKVIWGLFPGGAESEAGKRMQRAHDTRQPQCMETYSTLLQRWVEVNIYPTTAGLSIYFRDISTRKQADRRTTTLQEVTARFAEALTPLDVANVIVQKGIDALGGFSGSVALLSADGQFLDVMNSQFRVPGAAKEFTHIPIDVPTPHTVAVRTRQAVWANNEQDYTARFPQYAAVLKRNQIQSVVGIPLNGDGRVIGAYSLNFRRASALTAEDRDLLLALAQQCAQALERARLYEGEVRARQAAEAADRMKMQFLGMVSHELRTPLTSIKGFTTTLLADDVQFSPAEQHEFLSIVDEETDRLTDLVEQLLDLSRLQAGKLNIQPKAQPFENILNNVMPQLQVLTARHTLVTDVAPLPPVMADTQRIGQVLTNLVGNAVKFSPAGTQITLRAAVNDGKVQVDVADEGMGVPAGDRVAVFEAFRQLSRRDGSLPSRNGAGLGLAICKGIVEAHGGRIWLHENSPLGTVVSFTLAEDGTADSIGHANKIDT